MSARQQAELYFLYVKPDDRCLELLQYVDGQIDQLLARGARVRVVLVRGSPDKKTLAMVKKDKVNSIPTLVSTAGEKHVGVANIKRALAGDGPARRPVQEAHGDSYESYINDLMFKDGVAREDGEVDDRVDYAKLMARESKKQPKHRRVDAEPKRRARKKYDSDSDDEQPRRRRRAEDEEAPRQTGRRTVDYNELDTSNIDRMNIPRPDNVSDCADDALAEEMLLAYRAAS
jgi:hypothetical protein